jgi:hypothetical protein
MGNSGSTIGDIFFPDNPNRRRRAEQLKQQIEAFGNEFQQVKEARYEQEVSISIINETDETRDSTIDRIRSKLDALLKDRGFNGSQDLENKVRSILDGQELSKYNQLKSM